MIHRGPDQTGPFSDQVRKLRTYHPIIMSSKIKIPKDHLWPSDHYLKWTFHLHFPQIRLKQGMFQDHMPSSYTAVFTGAPGTAPQDQTNNFPLRSRCRWCHDPSWSFGFRRKLKPDVKNLSWRFPKNLSCWGFPRTGQSFLRRWVGLFVFGLIVDFKLRADQFLLAFWRQTHIGNVHKRPF